MTESFEQRGGCHCGALRYTMAMPPRWIHACHCTDCQRHTGSAFGLVAAVPRPGDKWHLDEIFIRIQGVQHYLWRAVDQDGVAAFRVDANRGRLASW
jgi:hypothetical protein